MGAGVEPPDRTADLEQRIASLERQFATFQTALIQAGTVKSTPPPPPATERTPLLTHPPEAAAHRIAEDQRLEESVGDAPTGSASDPLFHVAENARGSLEDRLGSQIFNRIGIVLLLIGTSWFLKLAVDRGWIVPSPVARVIAGLVAGAGFVLWSERFRHKGFAAFSYSLKALGTGVLYLSLWAGYRIYGLLPAALALSLMIAVTAWNAYMAWVQNALLLAAYALAGGFATPVLLSTGGNHETFLFTYLLALDIATVALVRLKAWPRLLVGAFPATVAFFIVWYVQFWAPARPLSLTSFFIGMFGAVFGSVALGEPPGIADDPVRARAPRTIAEILLPLGNAVFVTLAYYSVLEDSGHPDWLPWTAVALGAAYLLLMRLPQRPMPSAIHLSLAVVLLTIAIPLKASGHWITTGWLVEGLALVWVSARMGTRGGDAPRSSDPSNVLRWLALGALALGFCGVVGHLLLGAKVSAAGLWNSDTATALLGVAAFAGTAWIAYASRGEHWRDTLTGALVATDATAFLLAWKEVALSWERGMQHAPLSSPAFRSALLGLLIFAGVIAAALYARREGRDERLWGACAAASSITFNLVAILTGVREVASVWQVSGSSGTDLDAGLKQALAISGFLMIYAAALLVIGFLRRSAFLRWQGLILLLFTICKAFLYDMRNLSQGYRVVSFLALGALLMAVSFAYQRDWLSLRGSAEDPRDNPTGAAR